MTCREFIEFLMAYLGDELPPEQHAAFEDHLKICPNCVDYLQTYTKSVELGRSALKPSEDAIPMDVPEDLIKAVLDATQADK